MWKILVKWATLLFTVNSSLGRSERRIRLEMNEVDGKMLVDMVTNGSHFFFYPIPAPETVLHPNADNLVQTPSPVIGKVLAVDVESQEERSSWSWTGEGKESVTRTNIDTSGVKSLPPQGNPLNQNQKSSSFTKITSNVDGEGQNVSRNSSGIPNGVKKSERNSEANKNNTSAQVEDDNEESFEEGTGEFSSEESLQESPGGGGGGPNGSPRRLESARNLSSENSSSEGVYTTPRGEEEGGVRTTFSSAFPSMEDAIWRILDGTIPSKEDEKTVSLNKTEVGEKIAESGDPLKVKIKNLKTSDKKELMSQSIRKGNETLTPGTATSESPVSPNGVTTQLMRSEVENTTHKPNIIYTKSPKDEVTPLMTSDETKAMWNTSDTKNKGRLFLASDLISQLEVSDSQAEKGNTDNVTVYYYTTPVYTTSTASPKKETEQPMALDMNAEVESSTDTLAWKTPDELAWKRRAPRKDLKVLSFGVNSTKMADRNETQTGESPTSPKVVTSDTPRTGKKPFGKPTSLPTDKTKQQLMALGVKTENSSGTATKESTAPAKDVAMSQAVRKGNQTQIKTDNDKATTETPVSPTEVPKQPMNISTKKIEVGKGKGNDKLTNNSPASPKNVTSQPISVDTKPAVVITTDANSSASPASQKVTEQPKASDIKAEVESTTAALVWKDPARKSDIRQRSLGAELTGGAESTDKPTEESSTSPKDLMSQLMTSDKPTEMGSTTDKPPSSPKDEMTKLITFNLKTESSSSDVPSEESVRDVRLRSMGIGNETETGKTPEDVTSESRVSPKDVQSQLMSFNVKVTIKVEITNNTDNPTSSVSLNDVTSQSVSSDKTEDKLNTSDSSEWKYPHQRKDIRTRSFGGEATSFAERSKKRTGKSPTSSKKDVTSNKTSDKLNATDKPSNLRPLKPLRSFVVKEVPENSKKRTGKSPTSPQKDVTSNKTSDKLNATDKPSNLRPLKPLRSFAVKEVPKKLMAIDNKHPAPRTDIGQGSMMFEWTIEVSESSEDKSEESSTSTNGLMVQSMTPGESTEMWNTFVEPVAQSPSLPIDWTSQFMMSDSDDIAEMIRKSTADAIGETFTLPENLRQSMASDEATVIDNSFDKQTSSVSLVSLNDVTSQSNSSDKKADKWNTADSSEWKHPNPRKDVRTRSFGGEATSFAEISEERTGKSPTSPKDVTVTSNKMSDKLNATEKPPSLRPFKPLRPFTLRDVPKKLMAIDDKKIEVGKGTGKPTIKSPASLKNVTSQSMSLDTTTETLNTTDADSSASPASPKDVTEQPMASDIKAKVDSSTDELDRKHPAARTNNKEHSFGVKSTKVAERREQRTGKSTISGNPPSLPISSWKDLPEQAVALGAEAEDTAGSSVWDISAPESTEVDDISDKPMGESPKSPTSPEDVSTPLGISGMTSDKFKTTDSAARLSPASPKDVTKQQLMALDMKTENSSGTATKESTAPAKDVAMSRSMRKGNQTQKGTHTDKATTETPVWPTEVPKQPMNISTKKIKVGKGKDKLTNKSRTSPNDVTSQSMNLDTTAEAESTTDDSSASRASQKEVTEQPMDLGAEAENASESTEEADINVSVIRTRDYPSTPEDLLLVLQSMTSDNSTEIGNSSDKSIPGSPSLPIDWMSQSTISDNLAEMLSKSTLSEISETFTLPKNISGESFSSNKTSDKLKSTEKPTSSTSFSGRDVTDEFNTSDESTETAESNEARRGKSATSPKDVTEKPMALNPKAKVKSTTDALVWKHPAPRTDIRQRSLIFEEPTEVSERSEERTVESPTSPKDVTAEKSTGVGNTSGQLTSSSRDEVKQQLVALGTKTANIAGTATKESTAPTKDEAMSTSMRKSKQRQMRTETDKATSETPVTLKQIMATDTETIKEGNGTDMLKINSPGLDLKAEEENTTGALVWKHPAPRKDIWARSFGVKSTEFAESSEQRTGESTASPKDLMKQSVTSDKSLGNTSAKPVAQSPSLPIDWTSQFMMSDSDDIAEMIRKSTADAIGETFTLPEELLRQSMTSDKMLDKLKSTYKPTILSGVTNQSTTSNESTETAKSSAPKDVTPESVTSDESMESVEISEERTREESSTSPKDVTPEPVTSDESTESVESSERRNSESSSSPNDVTMESVTSDESTESVESSERRNGEESSTSPNDATPESVTSDESTESVESSERRNGEESSTSPNDATPESVTSDESTESVESSERRNSESSSSPNDVTMESVTSDESTESVESSERRNGEESSTSPNDATPESVTSDESTESVESSERRNGEESSTSPKDVTPESVTSDESTEMDDSSEDKSEESSTSPNDLMKQSMTSDESTEIGNTSAKPVAKSPSLSLPIDWMSQFTISDDIAEVIRKSTSGAISETLNLPEKLLRQSMTSDKILDKLKSTYKPKSSTSVSGNDVTNQSTTSDESTESADSSEERNGESPTSPKDVMADSVTSDGSSEEGNTSDEPASSPTDGMKQQLMALGTETEESTAPAKDVAMSRSMRKGNQTQKGIHTDKTTTETPVWPTEVPKQPMNFSTKKIKVGKGKDKLTNNSRTSPKDVTSQSTNLDRKPAVVSTTDADSSASPASSKEVTEQPMDLGAEAENTAGSSAEDFPPPESTEVDDTSDKPTTDKDVTEQPMALDIGAEIERITNALVLKSADPRTDIRQRSLIFEEPTAVGDISDDGDESKWYSPIQKDLMRQSMTSDKATDIGNSSDKPTSESPSFPIIMTSQSIVSDNRAETGRNTMNATITESSTSQVGLIVQSNALDETTEMDYSWDEAFGESPTFPTSVVSQSMRPENQSEDLNTSNKPSSQSKVSPKDETTQPSALDGKTEGEESTDEGTYESPRNAKFPALPKDLMSQSTASDKSVVIGKPTGQPPSSSTDKTKQQVMTLDMKNTEDSEDTDKATSETPVWPTEVPTRLVNRKFRKFKKIEVGKEKNKLANNSPASPEDVTSPSMDLDIKAEVESTTDALVWKYSGPRTDIRQRSLIFEEPTEVAERSEERTVESSKAPNDVTSDKSAEVGKPSGQPNSSQIDEMKQQLMTLGTETENSLGTAMKAPTAPEEYVALSSSMRTVNHTQIDTATSESSVLGTDVSTQLMSTDSKQIEVDKGTDKPNIQSPTSPEDVTSQSMSLDTKVEAVSTTDVDSSASPASPEEVSKQPMALGAEAEKTADSSAWGFPAPKSTEVDNISDKPTMDSHTSPTSPEDVSTPLGISDMTSHKLISTDTAASLSPVSPKDVTSQPMALDIKAEVENTTDALVLKYSAPRTDIRARSFGVDSTEFAESSEQRTGESPISPNGLMVQSTTSDKSADVSTQSASGDKIRNEMWIATSTEFSVSPVAPKDVALQEPLDDPKTEVGRSSAEMFPAPPDVTPNPSEASDNLTQIGGSGDRSDGNGTAESRRIAWNRLHPLVSVRSKNGSFAGMTPHEQFLHRLLHGTRANGTGAPGTEAPETETGIQPLIVETENVTCLTTPVMKVKKMALRKHYRRNNTKCPDEYPCRDFNSCSLWAAGFVGADFTLNKWIYKSYLRELFEILPVQRVEQIEAHFEKCYLSTRVPAKIAEATHECPHLVKHYKYCLHSSQYMGLCKPHKKESPNNPEQQQNIQSS